MMDIEKDLELVNNPAPEPVEPVAQEQVQDPKDEEVERRAQNIAQERNFKMPFQ